VTDETQPDVLRLNLTVAHYFRPDGSPAPRRAGRAAVPPSAAQTAPSAPKPTPALGGLPE